MSNKHFMAALVLASAGGGMATQAFALDPQGYRTAEDLVITPLLTVRERYDDNIRAKEINAQSSFVTSVEPSVEFSAEGRTAEFSFLLAVPSYIYHSSQEDNHTDIHATSSLDLDFDRRNRLGLTAGVHKQEDPTSVVQSLQNDRWRSLNAAALYGYGAETARGQIEAGARYEQVRFQNDLVLPGGAILNADRDRDVQGIWGTFYLAVGPKTKLLLEARDTQFDYVTNTGINSSNQALLAGVTWEATGFTKGTVKAGSETKSFEAAGLPDADHSMWEVSAEWTPLTYSRFTLSSASRLDEGTNGASVVETQTWELKWNHQWLERLSSEVFVGKTQQDYVGTLLPSGQARADDISRMGLGVIYNMRRWLDIGLSYSQLQNDSNDVGRSYDRNIIGLNADISL